MNIDNICKQVSEYVMRATDKQFSGLSVNGLAHSFNIDRSKLSRNFKQYMNMNLDDFLFKQKMIRAAFLLHDEKDITVKEVCEKIGYNTYDYFIRKFKEFHGIAPGKYKEIKHTPRHRKDH